MAVNYKAPGEPVKDATIERATTQILLLAKEKVDKKHNSMLGKSADAVQKGLFSEKVDDSIRRTAATKAVTSGIVFGATVATGGLAAPIVLAVAIGGKVISATIDRAFSSTVRGKRKQKLFGVDVQPPDASVREFIKSVTHHFVQANKGFDKIRASLVPGGGLDPGKGEENFSKLVKSYAQFRHDLDKSALYLEGLLLLSIAYYFELGLSGAGKSQAIGLLPNGKIARDQLVQSLRRVHSRAKGNRQSLDEKEKLFLKYGIDPKWAYACCPSDPFDPQHSIDEVGEIVPTLVKLHKEFRPQPLDPRVDEDVRQAQIEDADVVIEITTAFNEIVHQLDTPNLFVKWKHSIQRTWHEKQRKDKGDEVISNLEAAAGIVLKLVHLPAPGVTTALSFVSSKLWGVVGEKKKWFGTDQVKSLWNGEKKTIQSARLVKSEDLKALSIKVQGLILEAARELKFAEQALTVVTVSTKSHVEKRADGTSTGKIIDAAALKKPDQAAKKYYEYIYHIENSIDYTHLIAIFESSLALGISELYAMDAQLFPHLMQRLAWEITSNAG